MRAEAFQQDRLRALVLHELEDHPQIITRTARPRAGEPALELVRLELPMKGVLRRKASTACSSAAACGCLRANRRLERTNAVEGRSSRFKQKCV